MIQSVTSAMAQKIPNERQENLSSANQNKSSLYKIAASRLAQNTPTLIATGVVITALSNLPMASASCGTVYQACVAGCTIYTSGGIGPCRAACATAYAACRAAAAYFGLPF